MIVDLSSPHDNDSHPSVNDLINKEECSLSYVRIDDAIAIIQKLGKDTTMCKTDISDAFKLIPIHPSQPGKDGHKNMTILFHIFESLRIPMALHKTCGPSTVVEYLGIVLDSHNMEARLPDDKLRRDTDILTSFQDRPSCTKRDLLQLLGHLNFASKVIIPGRSFVSHIIKLSTTVKALHHHVKLNHEFREDVNMWLLFLKHWNGIGIFYDSLVTSTEAFKLYTDASGTRGFGGFLNGQWFAQSWPPHLQDLVQTTDELSIAFKELYPIMEAAMIWGHRWKGLRTLFMCDNTATVAILRKGRSKSSHIMSLMRRLTMCAARNMFVILADHVPGRYNSIADSLSRLQMYRFRQLAPEADLISCQVPHPQDVLWSSVMS